MLPRASAVRAETGKPVANRSIVSIFSRGWTIGTIGVLITCAVAMFLTHRPATYWSRTQVLFVAPLSKVNPNGLEITPSSLIATAGVVAKLVDHSDSSTRVVSEGVTLVGEGIKHGYSVTVPNSGGQWANNFTQSVLDVQVVGSSEAEVSTTVNQLVVRIKRALTTIQREAHVAAVNLVRTQSTPPEPPIYRQHGSHIRAGLATLLLGFGLTAAAVVAARRRYRDRSQHPVLADDGWRPSLGNQDFRPALPIAPR